MINIIIYIRDNIGTVWVSREGRFGSVRQICSFVIIPTGPFDPKTPEAFRDSCSSCGSRVSFDRSRQ